MMSRPKNGPIPLTHTDGPIAYPIPILIAQNMILEILVPSLESGATPSLMGFIHPTIVLVMNGAE
jgi:hypothetical protein